MKFVPLHALSADLLVGSDSSKAPPPALHEALNPLVAGLNAILHASSHLDGQYGHTQAEAAQIGDPFVQLLLLLDSESAGPPGAPQSLSAERRLRPLAMTPGHCLPRCGHLAPTVQAAVVDAVLLQQSPPLLRALLSGIVVRHT